MENLFGLENFLNNPPNLMNNLVWQEKDDEKLKTLLEDLKNYNILDFLCKVSALNLNPYNQNKCIIFDRIIDYVLRYCETKVLSDNYMSMKKFKHIIDNGMTLNIAKGIDPVEMPFIQRVQFNGNKWVFSGTNIAPAYNLQNFIDVLFDQKNDLDSEYILIVNHIVNFILEISTRVVENLEYTNDVFKHHEINNVYYPSSGDFFKLTQSLIFSEDDFDGIVDDGFRNLIYYKSERTNNIDIQSDNCSFYYYPFLQLSDNKFMVLNISMLVPFAIYNILKIADDFGIKEKVVNLYNEKTWKENNKALQDLGHHELNAETLGFELINTEQYKEALYSAFNDGVLLVRYFCDDSNNYDYSNMFSSIMFDMKIDNVEERWRKLIDLKIKENNIYQLTILNSFGRGIRFSFAKPTCPKNMTVSPFELYCISINERNHPNFIPHYLNSKQSVGDFISLYADEINYLVLYSENGYSFYVDDNVDPRTTNLYAGYGDSVDYLNKALLEQDKHLAEIPSSKYYREIVLNDKDRNIYCCTDKSDFTLMNRFNNIDIWVSAFLPSSIEELNLVRSVLDLITYWLSECKKIIEGNSYVVKSLKIENYFTGNIQDYYLVNDANNNGIIEYLYVKIEENTIKINWTPMAFANFASNKTAEKELIALILNNISNFSQGKFVFENYEKIFDNPLKTKIFSLDYMKNPYFKPIDERVRHISQEYEHQILDEIGYYFLHDKKYNYGIIKGVEKNLICNEIVSFLYNKLQSIVKESSQKEFYELLYYDLEKIIFSMMVTQRRYAYDIACYPERKEKIDHEYNELNKSSIATKFLLEYAAAIPPTGANSFSLWNYEYLLAICSLIVEWAHNSDMFKYKMIDNDLEMLKSGRIGLKKDKIENLAKSNYVANRKRLNAISNPTIDLYSPHQVVSNEELDVAFEDEFSYTYTELFQCIMSLIDFGEKIKSNVKKASVSDVIQYIKQTIVLSEEKIRKIIDDFSLTQREDFMKPLAPYNKHDVSPWKFNRRLSFIRRPITNISENLIWGNRQLYHSLLYLYDLVANGKLPVSKGGKFESYIGALLDKRGNDFNDAVANKLRSFDSIIVDEKVKKINKKPIANDLGQDLGDIDVLVIVPTKKKIVVIEVKDFAFAKNPYEMHQEYENVFCDKGKKLCYISKHKRRVEWVKNHMNDLKAHYNLTGDKWNVCDALVVDESIISNEFYHKKQKIILYSDLSKEIIFRI